MGHCAYARPGQHGQQRLKGVCHPAERLPIMPAPIEPLPESVFYGSRFFLDAVFWYCFTADQLGLPGHHCIPGRLRLGVHDIVPAPAILHLQPLQARQGLGAYCTGSDWRYAGCMRALIRPPRQEKSDCGRFFYLPQQQSDSHSPDS